MAPREHGLRPARHVERSSPATAGQAAMLADQRAKRRSLPNKLGHDSRSKAMMATA